jgi:hypothetical protein
MAKAQAHALSFPDLDEVLGVLDAGVEKVIADAQENVAKSTKTVEQVRKKTGDVRALKKTISSACQTAVVSSASILATPGELGEAGEARRQSTPDGQR